MSEDLNKISYEAEATNLKGESVGYINTDNKAWLDEFIKENESILVSIEVKENDIVTYQSKPSNLKDIIVKIEKGTSLKEKEIKAINRTSVCSVNGFTYEIGHLTVFGQNTIISAYKEAILEELNTHYKKI